MTGAKTAHSIKRIDEAAINDCGIPGLILMENAGRGVADEVLKYAALLRRKGRRPSAAIFCGKGNNGGDGMVCARHISNNGIKTRVYIIGGISSIKNDPAVQLNILQKSGIGAVEIKESDDLKLITRGFKADIIVDAIFGISFKGEARGLYKEVIEFINAARAYKFSVDVPSGLDATQGTAGGVCVKANQTITMGFLKTGFYRKDGPGYAGRIKVVDIGLPRKSPSAIT